MGCWSLHDHKGLGSSYVILERIGSGSYADVYRARRRSDDLIVALKEVHDYQSSRREIQALLRLRNQPHVIHLFEYFWLDDDAALVLEYLPSDLAAVIQEGRRRREPKGLSDAEIKPWMLQLLQGVAACHAASVLHRDLKPSNLLISASGVLKVADFGQARILERQYGAEPSQQSIHDILIVGEGSAPLGHEFLQDRIVTADDARKIDTQSSEALNDGSLAFPSLRPVVCTQPLEPYESLGPNALEIGESQRGTLPVADFCEEKADAGDRNYFPEAHQAIGMDGCESLENRLSATEKALSKKRLRRMANGEMAVEGSFTGEDVTSVPNADVLTDEDMEPHQSRTEQQVQNDYTSYIFTKIEGFNSEHDIYKSNIVSQEEYSDDSEALGGGHSSEMVEEDVDFRQQAYKTWVEPHADQSWVATFDNRHEWDLGSEQSHDNPSERSAELLDGDVGFYREDVGSTYTGCVGTRWYRAPELLYGATIYGTGVDMWAVGCMFGELLLGQSVFPGVSDIDQLSRIVRVLGNPNEENWPGVSKLPDYGKISFADDRACFSLHQYIKEGSEEAHELLERLITYDPASRLSAVDALKHAYFLGGPFATPAHELRVPSANMDSDDISHTL